MSAPVVPMCWSKEHDLRGAPPAGLHAWDWIPPSHTGAWHVGTPSPWAVVHVLCGCPCSRQCSGCPNGRIQWHICLAAHQGQSPPTDRTEVIGRDDRRHDDGFDGGDYNDDE